jgi:hypothetical protein
MEAYSSALQMNPELSSNRESIESQIRHWIVTQSNSSRSVITIPVVVHVIYNTSEQNISDAQVQSQIDVLNEDYARLNADASQTPALFNNIVANCEIQFCLAKTDPFNQATSGITRKQTTASSFSIGSSMKYAATGGVNAWPSSNYLNIWVCNMANQVIGFATLPGTTIPAEDGVVITYKHFGRTGNVQTPYHKGRTATHEVGHWLNLIHIWGDDENSSNTCLGTDQVEDTPNQGSFHFGCPSSPSISCSNTGDMFMNFMDYTDDACMNAFTVGQKNRMLATLNSFRNLIQSSLACQPPIIQQVCDTLNNIVGGDGLNLYYSNEIVAGDTGYFTGTNSNGNIAYADFHSVSEPSTIEKIQIDFAYAYSESGLSELTIGIWDNDGINPPGSPGTLLSEVSLPLYQINLNIYNTISSEVELPSSLLLDGGFYVGFKNPENPNDTIVVYSNQIDEININSAWFQDSLQQWSEFSNPTTFNSPISLAIRPVICGTVGIPEYVQSPLEIYPNPAQDFVHIVFPTSEKIHAWQMFSIDGKKVLSGITSDSHLELNCSDLAQGIYIFQENQNGRLFAHRIAIMR